MQALSPVFNIQTDLSELHLVHALSSVPMQEGLAAEHGSKLLTDALEELLDGRAVADEGGSHLQATWRNVADSGLDIVRDPLDKVGAVLVLHIEHLLIDLLHGHSATEHGSDSEVAAVARITGSHHVLGVKHLLCQLGDSESSVLLRSTAGEWCEARHEEVETGEGNHVDCELAKVGIELARESKAGGDTAHGSRYEVVEIAIGRGGKLKCAEADVVQCLVVNAVCLIRVLD